MRGLLAGDVGDRGGAAFRFLPVAAFVVLALLWVAAPAAAAPAWLAPANLSEAGVHAESPQVAVDPQGDAVAVWKGYDGTNEVILASSRPAGGVWSAPVELSAPGQEPREPRIALDAQGDAVAVWASHDGANEVIQASSRSAGGAWSAPVDVSAAEEGAGYLRVALDANGDAVAVWDGFVGSYEIVQAASRKAGGAWSAPANLSAPGQSAYEPRVAIDSNGDAVAVWQLYNGSYEIVQAANGSALGTWSAPVDLSTAGQNASGAQIALDPQGDAIAVWQRYGTSSIVQAASRKSGGDWSVPVTLSPSGQTAYGPQVALDAQGDAIVVWENPRTSTTQTIQAASREAGGAWSAAVNLSETGVYAERPQVGLDAQGDAVAVWERSGAINWAAQAANGSVLGTWSAPVDLSAPGQSAGNPQVALDAQGDAVAVWERYDGTTEVVQAAAYDATGPQLRGLTVPTAGTAGRPLSFSASPFDAFSALGATSWSFGDGATAAGTVATHTYARPGTYQVTVTSADALDNTSTATRTLTVVAPAAPPVSAPMALAKAAARARVKNGKALLKLTCPASGACKGQVVLSTRMKKATKGHGARKKAQAKSVRIGAASFHLAAGAHATVAVKLNAKGLAALKASGRRGLKAQVGGSGVKPGPVVLKATPPHRAHRHHS